MTPAIGIPSDKSLMKSLSEKLRVSATIFIRGKRKAFAGEPLGRASLHVARCPSRDAASLASTPRAFIRLAKTMSGRFAHWDITIRASGPRAAASVMLNGPTPLAIVTCCAFVFGSPGISDGRAFPPGCLPVAAISNIELMFLFLDGLNSSIGFSSFLLGSVFSALTASSLLLDPCFPYLCNTFQIRLFYLMYIS